MVALRTDDASGLAEVGRLNGHGVGIPVIVASKVPGMAVTALAAGGVANGMANQGTIDSVVAVGAAILAMGLAGSHKRSGSRRMTPFAVARSRCRHAIDFHQICVPQVNVGNRMINKIVGMTAITVTAAGRHIHRLTIRCLQGASGLAMTGITVVMDHRIGLVNRDSCSCPCDSCMTTATVAGALHQVGMINGMFGQIGPVTRFAITTASRHEDCLTFGIDIPCLQGASVLMAGCTGIVNLRIVGINWSACCPANVGPMAANATIGARNSCAVIGCKFARSILVTLDTIVSSGITMGRNMVDGASRLSMTIPTG